MRSVASRSVRPLLWHRAYVGAGVQSRPEEVSKCRPLVLVKAGGGGEVLFGAHPRCFSDVGAFLRYYKAFHSAVVPVDLAFDQAELFEAVAEPVT